MLAPGCSPAPQGPVSRACASWRSFAGAPRGASGYRDLARAEPEEQPDQAVLGGTQGRIAVERKHAKVGIAASDRILQRGHPCGHALERASSALPPALQSKHAATCSRQVKADGLDRAPRRVRAYGSCAHDGSREHAPPESGYSLAVRSSSRTGSRSHASTGSGAQPVHPHGGHRPDPGPLPEPR